ncbi:hypothetical protein [Ureibacillus manganicus]|uniref:Lipoprotein n=1 Tax=Ureibacillus manganicus DSM 26584 TaxID=1384049 RepID=A0A0A3I5U9_9BACL|nr:hypothetical protein [Ureibacillus manganicus]KGR78078.1 hypothetical protein CD29_13070 [Ureibacillus manganicus DSM 26584]
MMKKLLFSTAFLFIFGLAGCGGNDDTNTTTNDVETETNTNVGTNTDSKTGGSTDGETTSETSQGAVSWQNEIGLIVSSEGTASEKISKVESFMENYEVSPEEVEQFKNDIISDYESTRYLGDPQNHEYMLAMLLKTYVIEKNNEGTPLGNFASYMHENIKVTYRGEEDKESDTVKANEAQMNEALSQIQAGT